MLECQAYTDLKLHASSSTCDVYTAVSASDQTQVVLKAYPSERTPDAPSRARREFELLARLAGPGVPVMLELDVGPDSPWLAMRRAPGVTLDSFVRTKLPTAQAFLHFAMNLTSLLKRVHAQRIIHKKIHPGNVLIDPESLEVHLLGFSGALPVGRSLREGATRCEATMQDGTLSYMAPEQSGRMNRGCDLRTDLYSLGGTFYFALTGSCPFAATDPLELIHAHMAKRPVSPLERRPALPPTLSRIVMKLLNKEPEERYQSAHSLLIDLQQSQAALARHGTIDDDLPLGTADAPDQPLFAKRLYGREHETSLLHQSYQRVVAGASELFLLSGPPGIGKSSLLTSLRDSVLASSGYVAYGKFDLYRQDRPYAGLAAAFDGWLEQILTERDESLEGWKTTLLGGLGSLASVMVDLVPDLGLVLGELEPVPALGPKESQARLALAVQRFVRSCASERHPLVLFLDDLQWADAGSLQLIEELLDTGGARSLLVFGTYRSNEVSPDAPLMSMVERLTELGVAVHSLEIGPLSSHASAAMLSHALSRSEAETRPLAEQISLKTGNSPLLIQQFVTYMYDNGAMRFDPAQGWRWDDSWISSAMIPDGAVAFMTAKIQRLSPIQLQVLTFASCVGDTFDAQLLAELRDSSCAEVESALYALSEFGLIAPCPEGFRFVHDRIRESAQAQLDAAERSRLHADTAQLLIARLPPEKLQERIFEVADHLRRADREIRDEARRKTALGVHFQAASAALGAGAAATASRYFEAALSLVAEADWQDDHDTLFALHLQASHSALQSGALERALTLLDECEHRTRTRLELARQAQIRIQVYALTRTPADAMRYVSSVLQVLGFPHDPHPSRLRLWIEQRRADWALRARSGETLLFPAKGGDLQWLAPLVVLSAASGIIIRLGLARFGRLVSARCMWMSARYGYVQAPGYMIASYGSTRWVGPSSIEKTLLWARWALEWDARCPHPTLSVTTQTQVYNMMYSRFWPRRKAIAPLPQLAERSRECGNAEWGYYALFVFAVSSSLAGVPIATSLEHFKELEKDRHREAAGFCVELNRLLAMSPEEFSSQEAKLPELASRVNSMVGGTHTIVATYCSYILSVYNRHDLVFSLSNAVAEAARNQAISSHLLDLMLFRGLAAASLLGSSRGAAARGYRRALTQSRRHLARWKAVNPDVPHMHMLLDAEHCSLQGKTRRALAQYGRAADGARAQGYVNHAAMTLERHARLLRDMRHEMEAADVLTEATRLYREWGARAKAEQLGHALRALKSW